MCRAIAGLILAFAVAFSAFALPAAAKPAPGDTIYVVDEYSPTRDPSADLAAAIGRAGAENKRILLVVGGDWCVWCEILDRFLAANADVHDEMARSFLILKVNYSRENANQAFLSAYPEAGGYPDFIILESDGAYLASQDTGALERGQSYHPGRMTEFARRWRRP